MSGLDDWTAEQADEFFTHMLFMVGPPLHRHAGYARAQHIGAYWKAAEARYGGRWPSYDDYAEWFGARS